ncbi:hypothetical protein NPIL_178751 [Nephila pilipes]|uniref:Uncharacterized protein n=1 Tax=Nephila pilipes TaxID=299642 RepID=A0A8X6TAJ3_NEPPI|nr:hypothetical protein NPIL_178751 [Nephila pilipes]
MMWIYVAFLKENHGNRGKLKVVFFLVFPIGDKLFNFPIGDIFHVLDPSNPSNREPHERYAVIVEGVRSKDERDYTGLKNKRDTQASENVRKTNPSALQSLTFPHPRI